METVSLPVINYRTEMNSLLEYTHLEFDGPEEADELQAQAMWVNISVLLKDHPLLRRMQSAALVEHTERFRRVIWQIAQASSLPMYGTPISLRIVNGSLLVVISFVISLAANYSSLKQNLPVIAADIQVALSLILKSIEHDLGKDTAAPDPAQPALLTEEPRQGPDATLGTPQPLTIDSLNESEEIRFTPRVKPRMGPQP